ncbi:sigma 54-interacting transcriptional regulator [uncultured Dysosmobacter sp.]|uniref:sigma 54-interacting transcriptional regulator n=1 Tax=uncultured Dysosmobacter sp. TaxID=2591384 RepID=UPI0026364AFA|nr:sigma 54-interacting transcriptional regulator [uncultured Dysosmobacter sp.]
MRIGDGKIIPINVRVICATNKALLRCIENGTFRADLYYRINVLNVALPPLRKRTADICPLFEYHLHLVSPKLENKFRYAGLKGVIDFFAGFFVLALFWGNIDKVVVAY